MEALGKMSIATIGAKPALVKVLSDEQLAKLGGKVPLMRVSGKATGLKMAVDQQGNPIFALTGTFLGINPQDGKEFTSGVLYLPGGLQEMIQAPLEAALNDPETGKNAAIRFAMTINGVKATNKAGYTFSADLIQDAAAADPLAELRAQLAGAPELKPLQIGADTASQAAAAQAAIATDAAQRAAADQKKV